ncbi:para-aminobenzoate synthase [Pleomassaria siparia CBS 279.74]|uniref:aminodeoxychorismate synthase n=1 Tax=Pleomassaria siparia CBS 279.74 TaxID=1314801 RepID=A0A6G1KED1_9PLEO|nr:para-aminobenzoate synthase [Pleomassaria siparia CBS 279.74]
MAVCAGCTKVVQWLAQELGLKTMRSAGKDVYIIILSRYLRLAAYGAVALILALYFEAQGFSDEHIGLFMTLTLLGDVLISLFLTLVADAMGRRATLLLGAAMMTISGAVFATTNDYAALLAAAIVGVISPGGNEIGPFRAVEESTLAHLMSEEKRADVFTWYVVMAVLGTSTGLVLGGQAVDHLQSLDGWTEFDAFRFIFWVYTGVGCVKAVMALFLSAKCERVEKEELVSDEQEPLLNGDGSNGYTQQVLDYRDRPTRWSNPISAISEQSRWILFKLCSLFFLDSLGSGMVPFSLVNFYMERKFSLGKGQLGGIMSTTWFISTIGNVFASSVAKRLGLVKAMVATHLPSSIFLALLPVPNGLPLTTCLLVGRAVLNSMDQAPRSAFISLVFLPEERTAVMGMVNILKTLSQSGGPWVTGVLAGRGHFWVAFVAAGSLKAAYDILLLVFFAGTVHERSEASEDLSDNPEPLGVNVIPDAESDRDARPKDDAVNTPGQVGSGDVANPFAPSGANSLSRCAHSHLFASLVVRCCLGTSQSRNRTLQPSALISKIIPPYACTMSPAILTQRARILFLDAYDSFSNNIVAQIEQSVDAEVVKIYIDEPHFLTNLPGTFADYLKTFDAVVAGPGPGSATEEKDVGLMNELWKMQDENLIPVLGICLGFQSLCLAHGAQIEKLVEPRHGLVAEILHKGGSIFSDVGQLLATQYHSLQVNIGHLIQIKRSVCHPGELWKPTETCPELDPIAWDFDNKRNGAVLMAVKHSQKPFWGVQFHPESICTNDEGTRLIQNWWKAAQAWRRKRSVESKERINQVSDSPSSPLKVDDHETFHQLHHSNPHVENTLNKKRRLLESASASDHGNEQWLSPAELAPLIAHGDGKSLPDLPPSIVHCATTGSGRLTVADVSELFDIPRNEAIVLESGLQSDLLPMKVGTGRYSIVGLIIPGETLRLHYHVDSHKLELRNGNDKVHTSFVVADPWEYIKTIMQHLKPTRTPPGPTFAPFWGGMMGYASYEAGLQTFGIDVSTSNAFPDICFAYITRSIVFDHQLKKIYVQSIRGPNDQPWVESTLEKIYKAVAQKSQFSSPNPTPLPKANPFETDAVLNQYLASCEETPVDRESYLDKVVQAQHMIANGLSYELCLTNATLQIHAQRPSLDKATSNELSWKLYKRLTGHNPAPFSAFLRLHNVHILSSSPERYISWDRNQSAQCRPIKGTVRKSPKVTRADAMKILSSSKERAENLMIVDLVRHQLHGVYGSGNVHVRQLMEVEEYETLYQLVSVIDAVPPGVPKARTPNEWEEPSDYISSKKTDDAEDMLGFEAFVQSLPPGSMTGAPKKRSCELLLPLENQERGVYSGVLGYLDVGGAGDFSVVIRTALPSPPTTTITDTWLIGAGGAITSQSTPSSEYSEMRGKFLSTAAAFLAPAVTATVFTTTPTVIPLISGFSSMHGLPTTNVDLRVRLQEMLRRREEERLLEGGVDVEVDLDVDVDVDGDGDGGWETEDDELIDGE